MDITKHTLNHYQLSRFFWDFAFDNPDKIKPNHAALYFFAIEHCNRLGWKEKFGLPTTMTMEAIGIKSYSVYKRIFDDLDEFGFFNVVEFSKNQYSSNVIALKENYKANDKASYKALDKALSKHSSKLLQSTSESTGESIVSIDKPITINKEPITKEQEILPLGFRLQKKFLEKNPGYPPRPSQDIPAIMTVAEFLFEQEYGHHKNLPEMDVGESEFVLTEWQKWCEWYSASGTNKSLETLVKFKLQEIYLELKNPKDGKGSSGSDKKVSGKYQSTGEGGY